MNLYMLNIVVLMGNIWTYVHLKHLQTASGLAPSLHLGQQSYVSQAGIY